MFEAQLNLIKHITSEHKVGKRGRYLCSLQLLPEKIIKLNKIKEAQNIQA